MRRQERTPIFDAVRRYVDDGVLPFHVPGHKQGRGLPAFREYVGERVMAMDLTCVPGLDNICNPTGVIREAEDLAAEALGAERAFFLVNGTTSGIQAMLMAVCSPGDEVILPRNAHKSATGGLILSGARPVYVNPTVDREFGISTGITPEAVGQALSQHPHARAVFVINPNYYGTASNLREIVRVAHSFGVPVCVDEAHGAHFPFHPDLPPSAMEAGADLAASSAHKLLGSLTQSSFLLLQGNLISAERVKAVLNLTQTTSPSYILLCSLDVARQQMALRGREIMESILQLALRARRELAEVEGLRLLDAEVVGRPGCFALDPTKITMNVRKLGISGYQAEKLLRRRFGLQVELSDLYNVLVLVTLGDDEGTVSRLVHSFRSLAGLRPRKNVVRFLPPLPEIPELLLSPREAFYGESRSVPLEEAVGEVSAEAIMAYPPGIPLVCPGEVVTREIVDYVQALKQEEAELNGPEDPCLERLRVVNMPVAPVLPLSAEDVG